MNERKTVSQEAIGRELVERSEDCPMPDRPAERQEIIKDRLRTPLRAVSRDALTAMLRRYNPAV